MNFFDQINSANDAILTAFRESILLNDNIIEAVVDLTPGGYGVGAGLLVDKVDPSITVRTSDFAAITVKQGDQAIILSIVYVVLSILPDDNGLTTITLRPI